MGDSRGVLETGVKEEVMGGEQAVDDRWVFYRDVSRSHPVLVRGSGIYLWDKDGNRYIDGCSGALVTNIGQGLPGIAEALAEQARTLGFAHQSRFTTPWLLELCRKVATLAPGDLDRVYLVSGGSEATETAMKMARQYFLERDGVSQKHKVIGRWHAFHGNTLGALSMSGTVGRRRKYAPMLVDFPHINPPYCYRCPHNRTYPECGIQCAHELEDVIKRESADYIAAFIAEPIGGAATGAIVPPPEYWRIIREICDRYDILLVVDEVMTGFGRTGRHFAIEHWGVVPDLMTVAKGMGAGYFPIGAVIARERIWEAFLRGSGKFVHGHTYGANPLACRVGCAVLDYYTEHDLAKNSADIGQYLLDGLLTVLHSHPNVGDVRGKGLMIGIELVQDRDTKMPFPQGGGQAAERFTRIALEEGVVVYPGGGAVDGVLGDHFLVGPPLIITKEQADELIDGLYRAFSRFQ